MIKCFSLLIRRILFYRNMKQVPQMFRGILVEVLWSLEVNIAKLF